MKLFDKKSLILLISVVSINLLCIISVSYAYFSAQIKGNEDAKEMVVHAGTMKITYTDTDEVSITNFLPGDSINKQFRIENTGSLETNYNIKILVELSEFKDKQDLKYTLTKNGEVKVSNQVFPYEDGYILKEEKIAPKGEESTGIDTYNLTLIFNKEDGDQNDNANKIVKFKIAIDTEKDISLYEYKEPLENNFYNTMLASEDTLYDDYTNLRYVGAEPSNYIWFNCNDYSTPSEETCEKWRIIGLFKDIDVVNGESTTKQDLVKIIRAESIGDLAWDSASSNSNNWATASLQASLNTIYYSGTKLSNGEGIKDSTRLMIEQVTWNIGALGSTYSTAKSSDWYTAERGEETYQSSRPTSWDGYIGLMYPSDYGYATSGLKDDPTTDREGCLNTAVYNWYSGSYQTNCAKNSWLFSTDYPWTITPDSSNFSNVFRVYNSGLVSGDNAISTLAVRPTLYLKSNVQIIDGKGTNEEPYRINA